MVIRSRSSTAALGIGVGLALVGAASSALADANGPGIETPIQSTGQLALVSVGDGHSAWLVPDHASGAGATLWTLRDGNPAQVAALAGVTPSGLEVGTDAAGAPVAIVASTPDSTQVPSFTLVRLDSGRAAALSLPRRGGSVEGAALDSGRVYFTVAPHGRRTRSTLWTGRISGTSVVRVKRLRSGRAGERYATVLADNGRLALTSQRPLRGHPDNVDAELPLYVGTPRHLRRVGAGTSSTGGVVRLNAVGFTRRFAIATDADATHERLQTLRISLATGHRSQLSLVNASAYRGLLNAAFDPASGRLVVSSLVPGPGGGYQVGFSNVLR